jgi:hypothetical protein
MALTLSTSSTFQNSGSGMSKIAISESIQHVEPAGPSLQVVNRKEIPKGSFQVNLPIWGRVSSAAVSEGVDLSDPQDVTVTVRTLSGTRHGALIFLSDRLIDQNVEDVAAESGSMLGNSVGRLLESDIVTLYDGFSTSQPGAGNNASLLHLGWANAYLRTDNNTTFGPAPSRPNAVMHPEQIRRLWQEVAGIQAGGTVGLAAQPIPEGITSEVVQEYFRGNERMTGMRVYESGVISRDGSGDAIGGIFAKEALWVAMEQEYKAAIQRDESLFGEELVGSSVWGEGEAVDPWGYELLSAADANA